MTECHDHHFRSIPLFAVNLALGLVCYAFPITFLFALIIVPVIFFCGIRGACSLLEALLERDWDGVIAALAFVILPIESFWLLFGSYF